MTMGGPDLLEMLLLGGLALVLVFWFGPGIKQAVEESRRAENPDWRGALIPLGLVVLFVILLIYLAASL